MSKEKSPNPITKDSKVLNEKKYVEHFSAQELKDLGPEAESKVWAESFVRNLNESNNHGKSN